MIIEISFMTHNVSIQIFVSLKEFLWIGLKAYLLLLAYFIYLLGIHRRSEKTDWRLKWEIFGPKNLVSISGIQKTHLFGILIVLVEQNGNLQKLSYK